jgi:hypothetical protein
MRIVYVNGPTIEGMRPDQALRFWRSIIMLRQFRLCASTTSSKTSKVTNLAGALDRNVEQEGRLDLAQVRAALAAIWDRR